MEFVCDASVLIDLEQVDLLSFIPQLGHLLHITQPVYDELEAGATDDIYKELILEDLVTLVEFEYEELASIYLLTAEYVGLSPQDCSCLFYADGNSVALLTGDGLLRDSAIGLGIEVHGTIWVIEQLLGVDLISSKVACDRLQELMIKNPRLPHDICEQKLVEWSLS